MNAWVNLRQYKEQKKRVVAESEISVQIVKPAIPIIWIDSSILINMAKASVGELSERDQERIVPLQAKLESLVKNQKAICPASEQLEEVEFGARLVNVCESIMSGLSLGITTKSSDGIKKRQIVRGMEACAGREMLVEFLYDDLFDEDPIELVANQPEYIVYLQNASPKWLIDWGVRNKESVHQQVESLRRDNTRIGITFNPYLGM